MPSCQVSRPPVRGPHESGVHAGDGFEDGHGEVARETQRGPLLRFPRCRDKTEGGGRTRVSLVWNNSHVEQGGPIAVILQYGHGTRTGGYVQGVDYINPALRPIFDSIVKQLESAVRG